MFTSADSVYGWNWVGDHIRPRVKVPDSWRWRVKVRLSKEMGYQRASYSSDTWTWEIRPIVDKLKRLGKMVFCASNPSLDRSFHGPSVNKGVEFSPNVQKVGFEVT